MDLRDWFRGRDSPPISKLLDLAERLPRHSVYRAAVADDEETALAIIEQYGDQPPASPSFGMDGWTYERELLVGLTEAVLSVRGVLIAANSKNGKVPKLAPLPRPRTTLDRALAARTRQKRQGLLGQLLPHEHPPTA